MKAKIPKGTIIDIEGVDFQLTTSVRFILEEREFDKYFTKCFIGGSKKCCHNQKQHKENLPVVQQE